MCVGCPKAGELTPAENKKCGECQDKRNGLPLKRKDCPDCLVTPAEKKRRKGVVKG